jgi:hypothetical protein
VALPESFPPGLDWIGGADGIALVLSFAPAAAVPVDLEPVPPVAAAPGPFPDLSASIAADACSGSRPPLLDGVTAPDGELAFVSASSCEAVAFVDPATGGLRALSVEVPAQLPADLFPFGPAPGASDLRVAISTRACVSPPPPALDSRGDPIAPGCRAGGPSHYTSFTSGAARVGDRLFVSTSNLGAGAGTLDPQFLPGTVLVFELGDGPPASIAPHPTTPILHTSGFNPTHVTPYRTPGGRALALVGVSGPMGLVTDDPLTPEREAGGRALGDAAIDVFDAEQLRLVATIPLGPAALAFDRLAIDPSGRIALVGSAIARDVFAVDLAPLDALASDAAWVRLDGVSGPDAVIFDAAAPLELPALVGGAPPETCPGYVVGVDFSTDGARAYATDFCDGTLTVIGVGPGGDPPAPVPPGRFHILETLALVSSVGPEGLGRPRALGALRVRPGRPGVDFDGPELAFLVGLPEGLLCGVAAPAPEPRARTLEAACLGALTVLAARRQRRLRDIKTRNGGTT